MRVLLLATVLLFVGCGGESSSSVESDGEAYSFTKPAEWYQDQAAEEPEHEEVRQAESQDDSGPAFYPYDGTVFGVYRVVDSDYLAFYTFTHEGRIIYSTYQEYITPFDNVYMDGSCLDSTGNAYALHYISDDMTKIMIYVSGYDPEVIDIEPAAESDADYRASLVNSESGPCRYVFLSDM